MAVIKEITNIGSVAMPIEEKWTIRRCRYSPDHGGKGRLCIATGIHGDEMMGQLIVYGVAKRIMAQPQHLRGTVDIYPMLNALGLDIGERMEPSGTLLDMNRSFPGTPDGTAMEAMCYAIVQDMLGADLVLDIHASTNNKSELYEVRMNANDAKMMLGHARALCPELIWIYPDKISFSASLTSTLCEMGTPALILEADERRRRPQDISEHVVEGIFCKMKDMGLWTGDTINPPKSLNEIPTIHQSEEVRRVTCENPGIYVPMDRIGGIVREGELLGVVIDALEGEALEEIAAPCDGLVFSQRSYSAVYPGTLIARLYRKERA